MRVLVARARGVGLVFTVRLVVIRVLRGLRLGIASQEVERAIERGMGERTSTLSHLGVTRSPVDIKRFSNDCLQAQLLANCRQRDVYIVQPLVPPTQEHR